MLQTQYKVPDPNAPEAREEYYVLIVDVDERDGVEAYFVSEHHGWWDAKSRSPLHSVVTLNPDGNEGYRTFADAKRRFDLQSQHRAREGFKFVFRPHAEEGLERDEITVE